METSDASRDYTPGNNCVTRKNGVCIDYLINETTEPPYTLYDKATFMGVGAYKKTPIEVAAMAFIGKSVASHTLLIVDSFQEMTGTNAKDIEEGKAALKSQLRLLQDAFDVEIKVEETSSFIETPAYRAIYHDVERKLASSELENELRKSLPEGEYDLTFALSEVAVTMYMQLEHGIRIKVGQRRGKLYDGVIGAVSGIGFSYLFPFFCLWNRRGGENTVQS
ncbi:hypothetical protein J4470_04525 [Candidatus Woesearchaeota archaeon]|nr:hypothetical protein [Candidatus Woesearchaeota archaeon]